MRQHWAFDHVANRVDTVNIGRPFAINSNLTTLCHLHAKRVQTQTFRIWLTTGRNQNHVSVQHFLGIGGFFQRILNLGFGLGRIHTRHSRAHDEL